MGSVVSLYRLTSSRASYGRPSGSFTSGLGTLTAPEADPVRLGRDSLREVTEHGPSK